MEHVHSAGKMVKGRKRKQAARRVPDFQEALRLRIKALQEVARLIEQAEKGARTAAKEAREILARIEALDRMYTRDRESVLARRSELKRK